MFISFCREGAGALHHGYEPFVLVGAGISDAVSAHVSVLGYSATRKETSHLPEQELPGSAAGPRPAAEKETQNMHHAVNKIKTRQTTH